MTRALGVLTVLVIGSAVWLLFDTDPPGASTLPPELSAPSRAPETTVPGAERVTPEPSSLLAEEPERVAAASASIPGLVRIHDTPVTLGADGQSCEGRVLDHDGTPVSGAMVLVYEDHYGHHGEHSLGHRGMAHTDPDGRFSMQLERLYEWWNLRIGVLVDGQRRFLGRLLPAGGATDIVLPEPQRVALELVFDDGTPVVGAHVLEGALTRGFDVDKRFLLTSFGETDAAGRLELTLPLEHPRLDIRLDHDEADHELAWPVDLDAWRADPTGALTLEIPRLACVVLELRGDRAAWDERRLKPRFQLQPMVQDDDGGWVQRTRLGNSFGTPGAFARFGQALENEHRFPRFVPGRARLVHWGDQDTVVFDALDVEPGTSRYVYTLPPPRPFEPGQRWALDVTLVGPDDEPLTREHPAFPGILPELVVTGSQGFTESLSPASHTGHAQLWSSLIPPVRIDVVGLTPAQAVTGLEPGDEARIVWDPAGLAPLLAHISVDLEGLDGLPDAMPMLSLSRPDREGITWRTPHPREVAVTPGEWTYSLYGARTQLLRGTATLGPGEQLELVALSAPPRTSAPPRPDGTLVGQVTVLSDDPLWVPSRIVGRTLDDESPRARVARVVSGAYRLVAPAGRYELSVSAARIPEWWLVNTDVDISPDYATWPLPREGERSVTREVEIRAGEVQTFDTVIDLRDAEAPVSPGDPQPDR